MENHEDLNSILPFLPLVVLESSSLSWPTQIVEALKSLSRGPDHSRVDSGEVLFLAISDLRDSLGLFSAAERLASSAAQGYALFFDELMSRVESRKWFGEVVPALATLLLQLPSLLEAHYRNADDILGGGKEGYPRVRTGLRLLGPQEAGIVFLSQELIGALLACSFFCLFPVINRGAKHLPAINFDHLFASLHPSYRQNQEHKIRCLIHYFERISSCMPTCFVSFERKVLPLKCSPHCVSYPQTDFWSKSTISLNHFEVSRSGLIEDQLGEALEVDFANKYIGGGSLSRGCVQEEIRFMINPELVVGMLFLPSMEDNEAIEIVGAERFSNYSGYASSFRFSGDYLDKKLVDCMGRRKTRIVAIDALCSPRMRQYRVEYLLRETNKAFCGFFDQSKYQRNQKVFQEDEICRDSLNWDSKAPNNKSENVLELHEQPSTAEGLNGGATGVEFIGKSLDEHSSQDQDTEDAVGVATGNWGCGAFGGDPEIKVIIQWLAASQLGFLHRHSHVSGFCPSEGQCTNMRLPNSRIRSTVQIDNALFFKAFHFVLHVWGGGSAESRPGESLDSVSRMDSRRALEYVGRVLISEIKCVAAAASPVTFVSYVCENGVLSLICVSIRLPLQLKLQSDGIWDGI
ncbi:Poly(ADP-ribose) glycohydrolase [Macleaya cordata]|uniref:poly(ADP-ribose) glycohydrolase n=1 Tax=Macleaya cordata TaxID=56857 RepID=A0A200R8H3_MACCD|nr:Poly(ADP-ribose) glycohydrolase [Macleaya cordata]